MYHNQLVPIPQNTRKIVLVKSGKAEYVYYQTARIYNSSKKYNSAKRTSIGKVSSDDRTMMWPNDKYYQFFPNHPYQESSKEPDRSCAIKVGMYIALQKIIAGLKLPSVLNNHFNVNELGMIFDLAAYSIITENNAGQYYPMYAYDHALFTPEMKVYSDSWVSKWLHSVTASQRIETVNDWNNIQNHKDRIYISYDSTNKNSQAGDVDFVEYGAAKTDVGLPIINYSLAYDIEDRIPLFYESYPGSITDVSQFRCMVEKARSYGYKNIGFILDRGYFSRANIQELDSNNYPFVIMVKGRKKLVKSIVLNNIHSFENKSSNYIEEFDVYGYTVKSKLFEDDTKNRYIHIYYNAFKAAGESYKFNCLIRKMKLEMDKYIGKPQSFSKIYEKYFDIYYNETELVKDNKNGVKTIEKQKILVAYAEKEDVIEEQGNLCGYFAIATSEKKTAKEAYLIYKSRDASEKLFRGDKSYLGDKSMRTHTTESTETKIFIEFVALIIRARLYTKLNDYNASLKTRLNYMTVPAAIRELEKIVMIKLPDEKYHLSYAVTRTQKNILAALGMSEADIIDGAQKIADTLQDVE